MSQGDERRFAAWARELRDVHARLRKALAESLQTPEFRKKLEDSGSTVAPINVEMNGFLAEESAKYQKIVDFANIKE